MRPLNIAEIETFARWLDFTTDEAKQITTVFYNEKRTGNYRLKSTNLENVNDYIREWENNWYRYQTWKQLVSSEADREVYGLSENECFDQMNKSIFIIPAGLFIQTVF